MKPAWDAWTNRDSSFISVSSGLVAFVKSVLFEAELTCGK
jgi:hypothetical protein